MVSSSCAEEQSGNKPSSNCSQHSCVNRDTDAVFSCFISDLIISLLQGLTCQHLNVIIVMGITCLTVRHLCSLCSRGPKNSQCEESLSHRTALLYVSTSLWMSPSTTAGTFFLDSVWISSSGREQCLQSSYQSQCRSLCWKLSFCCTQFHINHMSHKFYLWHAPLHISGHLLFIAL